MEFKEAIKAYLDKRAAEDDLFAVTYAKKNKNLNECCNYIMQEAKKQGNAVCMSDDEVYGLAVHYYDEDDIKNVKSVPKANVSVSKSPENVPAVELTEEEKETARQRAIKQYQDEEARKIAEAAKKRKEKKAETANQNVVQTSLF